LELRELQRTAAAVKFDEALVGYLLAIVTETREHEALEIGVSPRGAVAMRRAAQARALVDGRDFCIPEDVRDLAVDVFAHRVTVDPRSHQSRDGEETSWIIREILEALPIPL
ncbi:MAG TPA: ATPase, partial [Myxococcota bacterium]